MEYQTIKMTQVPPKNGIGKWRTVFDALKPNEAIKIEVKSEKEARDKAQSASRTIKVGQLGYKIRYRTMSHHKGWSLFMWKEEIKESKKEE